MKKVLLYASLLLSSMFANSQVVIFVDDIDSKLGLGYINAGGRSGFEVETNLRIDKKMFSSGLSLHYLSVPKIQIDEDDSSFDKTSKKINNFFNSLNSSWFLRAHLSKSLGLDEDKTDTYVGVDLGYKSIGAHIGGRYYLTDAIGVYGKVGYGFFDSVYSLFVDDDGYSKNYFSKTLMVSVGLSLDVY